MLIEFLTSDLNFQTQINDGSLIEVDDSSDNLFSSIGYVKSWRQHDAILM